MSKREKDQLILDKSRQDLHIDVAKAIATSAGAILVIAGVVVSTWSERFNRQREMSVKARADRVKRMTEIGTQFGELLSDGEVALREGDEDVGEFLSTRNGGINPKPKMPASTPLSWLWKVPAGSIGRPAFAGFQNPYYGRILAQIPPQGNRLRDAGAVTIYQESQSPRGDIDRCSNYVYAVIPAK
jgi:hypothetical protein